MNTNKSNLYIHYGIFNWLKFINDRDDLKNILKKKEDIYKYFIEEESKIKNLIYFKINPSLLTEYNLYTYNDLNVSYDDFEWNSYLIINQKLKEKGIHNKEQAWNHWIKTGKKEEKSFSIINNSNIHNGRFGNLFFINMFLHFMSVKYNLKSSYKKDSLFKSFGLNFYKGQKIYDTNLLVTDRNMDILLNNNTIEPSNLIISNNVWFQKRKFCVILKKYFYKNVNKKMITDKNIFKNRYNTNNDLFIHVRLGDVESRLPRIRYYYEEILEKEKGKYDNGYISSDSIDSEICVKMIKKYNLIVIDYDEINTIMFGNTCKIIILSGGSFSWMIGFFAFFADRVYYPLLDKTITKKWYGDIFTFSSWFGIEEKQKNTTIIES
jgi:hypothetical protein